MLEKMVKQFQFIQSKLTKDKKKAEEAAAAAAKKKAEEAAAAAGGSDNPIDLSNEKEAEKETTKVLGKRERSD